MKVISEGIWSNNSGYGWYEAIVYVNCKTGLVKNVFVSEYTPVEDDKTLPEMMITNTLHCHHTVQWIKEYLPQHKQQTVCAEGWLLFIFITEISCVNLISKLTPSYNDSVTTGTFLSSYESQPGLKLPS